MIHGVFAWLAVQGVSAGVFIMHYHQVKSWEAARLRRLRKLQNMLGCELA